MLRTVLAAACLGLLVGCGAQHNDDDVSLTSPTSINGPLAQVGALYRDYSDLKKKAPTGYKDFASSAESMPEGFHALRTGDVVAIWGVKLVDLSAEGTGDSADEVLAYQKETPQSGGYVLMKNRTIRQMTAEEFNAAPKAAGIAEGAKK